MAGLKVGVLISGRGSNLQALIDSCAAPEFPAEIVTVISNVPEVAGLERARQAGLPAMALDHRDYTDRIAFETGLTKALEAAGAEFVCLAGFMRVLTDHFVRHWLDRTINIHPALLPSFPGTESHARALAAGVKLHGCTVHYVRPEVDSGPIVGQAAVPVLPDDSEERLAARVLEAEHLLYPRCLRLIAEGRARLEGDRVVIEGVGPSGPLLIQPGDGA